MAKRICLGLLLLCAPWFASAQNLNYTYFDLGVSYIDIDDFDSGYDLGMKASVEIANNWHVFADVERAEIETAGVDVDFRELFVAAGYHWALSDTSDLFARLGGAEVKANVPGNNSVSEDGFGVEFGLRSQFSEQFEAGASLRYLDLDNSDEAAVHLEGQYFFDPNWALTADVKIGEESKGIFFGVRLNLE